MFFSVAVRSLVGIAAVQWSTWESKHHVSNFYEALRTVSALPIDNDLAEHLCILPNLGHEPIEWLGVHRSQQ